MRHLLVTTILTVLIAFAACDNVQNSFPDNISVLNTESLNRIKGTKLFVSTPEAYKPMESMVRLQRDNNTYFQAIEFPNSNFDEYKSKFTVQAIESQGAKVDIVKPIKYNGYNAIYFSGPSMKDGETKLGLAFGDETFVMMILGVCQSSDKDALNELNKILSTSYYDKSFELNPLELASFKFDESITGFKYATTIGNMFIYTPNGKSDLSTQKELSSMFQLMTIEAPNFSKAKVFLDDMILRYSVQGIETSNVQKRDIFLSGEQAYEVTMETKDKQNKIRKLYQVIIHKGTNAVLFLGADDITGNWLDKYRATVQTLKL